MNKRYTIEKTLPVNARHRKIFNVLLDVEHWHLWTASITAITILSDGALMPGSKIKVLQPKLLPATWTVTQIDEDVMLKWEKKSLGLKMISEHEIWRKANETHVTIRIIYEGFLAALAYKLSRTITNSYMTMEINGIQRECTKQP